VREPRVFLSEHRRVLIRSAPNSRYLPDLEDASVCVSTSTRLLIRPSRAQVAVGVVRAVLGAEAGTAVCGR
jgi:hypothetical protein